MIQYLSSEEQGRFAELQARLSQLSITAQEQQELLALVAKAQQAAQARQAAIDQVKALIRQHGLSADQLFSPEELAASQPEAVADRPRGPRARLSGAAPRQAARRSAAAASGPVLIQVKVGRGVGAPSRFRKGQKMPPFVPKNFKALDQGGQLAANLAHYYTEEGRKYFMTSEGRDELDRLIAFIQSGPSKPRA